MDLQKSVGAAQLESRNRSCYLIGKQYEAEKKAAKIFRGNQYTLA